MTRIEEFKRRYPKQKVLMKGKEFSYRYFKNESTDKTVVLLGDTGLGNLLFLHFEEFAESYSVLTFDYPVDYVSIQELVDVISDLLKDKRIQGILVGQALGGLLAQIIAQQYPEVVKGLILYNTGTLAADLNTQGKLFFENTLSNMEKMLQVLKRIPFALLKGTMKKVVLKEVSQQLSQTEKSMISEICDEMVSGLTKEFQMHTLSLSMDLKNHWNMTPDDFASFQGRVLLMLSDMDKTYDDNMRCALIDIMPNPKVVTNIHERQIDLMVRTKQYMECVKQFIDGMG